MTRPTSTSILATLFVALSLAASPAMSQAAGGPGGGGGGGGGPGGGASGGATGGGGYSSVLTHAAPPPCTANCYRQPQIEMKPRDYSCSTWRKILIGADPRCQDPRG